MNKVYLLGDSITQGLGSKRVNFDRELQSLLGGGYSIVNLAHTGTTIDHAVELLVEGRIMPAADGKTVCVIVYGNVDAQIRPSRGGRVFPRIPRRYRGNGMLMPRPFYSHTPWKRAGQYADNLTRKALATLIKTVDGTEQWVSIEHFTDTYGKVLDGLEGLGAEVVCCSCVYIDEALFPGCQEQYVLFNERIMAAAAQRGLPYVDFYGSFREHVVRDGWDFVYNKDHFHPNGEGYRLMAEEIARAVFALRGNVLSASSLSMETSARSPRSPLES